MGVLDGLNPEQLAAVRHDRGPLLVVAGAGTGKTQVITRRIAHLIAEGCAKPSQILALTFTEKAAREMGERLYDMIGWESFQIPVMTFHAFGAELLGRYASHMGRSVRGGLLNDTQKVLLLQQHINRINLTYYGPQADVFEFLEGIVEYIGRLQNAAITIEAYEAYVRNLEKKPGDMHPKDIEEQRDLVLLYRLYEDVKQEVGAYDYQDQLQLPLKILQERPNLAERLAREYKYVLVDEYQDTNPVQDELLRCFVGRTGNLFAVGDDDQAIYGFRGAEIGNILSFSQHFNLDKPVALVRNYRSGQTILDHAYRLIQHNNPERLEERLGLNKRLIALHDKCEVQYNPYRTPVDEQEAIVAQISERLESGISPHTMAVLAATHAPLKSLAKMMRSRGVPFALSTAVNIFEQPEIISLWFLLRWVCFAAQEEAIGHVLLGPLFGWSAENYRRVLERSRDQLISVEEALAQDDSEAAREVVANLAQWRAWSRELPVSQLAFRLVFETGIGERWQQQAERNQRMVRVFEDLQRWLNHMQDFESVAIDPMAGSYMTNFPKPPVLETTEPVGDSEGVQLLTVHASKGLEFETVFLIGCTHRNWSGGASMGRAIPEELKKVVDLPPVHEYRRLMYVAATRAKKYLYVSAATQTMNGAKQAVSPLVTELFGDNVTERITPEGISNEALLRSAEKLKAFYPLTPAFGERKLPFESSDGWLDLSVTSLGGYDYCPFEFYMQNVLQIKQPFGPQLAFGNVLHRVFELYYKSKMRGEKQSLAGLRARLEEWWTDQGYERREIATADKQLALRVITYFWDREEAATHKVLGSEVSIRFEIPEAKLRLRGKIDVLLETVAGVQIRDFKTGRTKTDAQKLARDAKDNFQLRTYALAYEYLNGHTPNQVALDYIVTGVIGEAELSATILRNHRAKLISLAEQIRSYQFAPNVSSLHTCAAIRYYGTGEQEALIEEALTKKVHESA